MHRSRNLDDQHRPSNNELPCFLTHVSTVQGTYPAIIRPVHNRLKPTTTIKFPSSVPPYKVYFKTAHKVVSYRHWRSGSTLEDTYARSCRRSRRPSGHVTQHRHRQPILNVTTKAHTCPNSSLPIRYTRQRHSQHHARLLRTRLRNHHHTRHEAPRKERNLHTTRVRIPQLQDPTRQPNTPQSQRILQLHIPER